MKIFIILSLLTFFILQVSCERHAIPVKEALPTSPGSASECPLEKRNWMKVTTTYDRAKVINVAGRIGAAASADSVILKKLISGNANISIADSLTKTINEVTKDSMEVSQEFYENFQNQRTSLCNIIALTKMSWFKKDKNFIEKLQNEYFEIGKTFRAIKENEEKKNP